MPSLSKKAVDLALAVTDAERRQAPANARWMLDLVGRACFAVTDAPRSSVHIPTTPDETYQLFDELRKVASLPQKIRALDLGCGIGSFACSMALYLQDNGLSDFHVTGIEISPSMIAEAKKLTESLSISNLTFINKDFTGFSEEDLKVYNIIYIFKPFKDGFNPMMEELLPKLAPDTLLITRLCMEVKVLDSELFRLILNPLHKDYGEAFAVYIRTRKKAQD